MVSSYKFPTYEWVKFTLTKNSFFSGSLNFILSCFHGDTSIYKFIYKYILLVYKLVYILVYINLVLYLHTVFVGGRFDLFDIAVKAVVFGFVVDDVVVDDDDNHDDDNDDVFDAIVVAVDLILLLVWVVLPLN